MFSRDGGLEVLIGRPQAFCTRKENIKTLGKIWGRGELLGLGKRKERKPVAKGYI